jgi:hypothetical protein
VRRAYVSSSDADGGTGAEESSENNDKDADTGKRQGVVQRRKRSSTMSIKLPPRLMDALTIPPPPPLITTLDHFISDFMSKFPPAPKSYSVTVALTIFRVHSHHIPRSLSPYSAFTLTIFRVHSHHIPRSLSPRLPQVAIGSRARPLNMQVTTFS